MSPSLAVSSLLCSGTMWLGSPQPWWPCATFCCGIPCRWHSSQPTEGTKTQLATESRIKQHKIEGTLLGRQIQDNSSHPRREFFQHFWALNPECSSTDWALCFSSIQGWASQPSAGSYARKWVIVCIHKTGNFVGKLHVLKLILLKICISFPHMGFLLSFMHFDIMYTKAL